MIESYALTKGNLRLHLVGILGAIAALLPAAGLAQAVPTTTVQPSDNGAALINPGMGWTMHYYSNVARNYGFQAWTPVRHAGGFSRRLHRLSPSALGLSRTRRGKVQLGDLRHSGPALDRQGQADRTAGHLLRELDDLRHAEVGQGGRSQGHVLSVRQRPRTSRAAPWDPFFDDPGLSSRNSTPFSAPMRNATTAIPTWSLSMSAPTASGAKGTPTPAASRTRSNSRSCTSTCILKYFKKTLLCISDDFAGHNKPGERFPITDYAFSKGITLRDDSILAAPKGPPWYHAEMAGLFWPRFPVILEHQHYAAAKRFGHWNPETIIASVEAYHASFMSIHAFPREYLRRRPRHDRPDQPADGIPDHAGQRDLACQRADRHAQKAFTEYKDLTRHGDLAEPFQGAMVVGKQGSRPVLSRRPPDLDAQGCGRGHCRRAGG